MMAGTRNTDEAVLNVVGFVVEKSERDNRRDEHSDDDVDGLP